MTGPASGHRAEEIASEKWDLDKGEHLPAWADLENPRTRARYQVKAGRPRSSGREPRARLWEDQHRALLGYTAHAAAWYAVVLLEKRPGGGAHAITRLKPQTVTQVVRALGGWTEGGHDGGERQGQRQKKVPLDVLTAARPVAAAERWSP